MRPAEATLCRRIAMSLGSAANSRRCMSSIGFLIGRRQGVKNFTDARLSGREYELCRDRRRAERVPGDAFSREMLGWHLSRSDRSRTADAALEPALIARASEHPDACRHGLCFGRTTA